MTYRTVQGQMIISRGELIELCRKLQTIGILPCERYADFIDNDVLGKTSTIHMLAQWDPYAWQSVLNSHSQGKAVFFLARVGIARDTD